MILQGNSIRLRQAIGADVETIFLWENNVENWFVSDTIAPYTVADIEDFVLNRNDIFISGQTRFIIEDEMTNSIGCLDLFDFNAKNKRLGIGILIDNEFRGKGLGKEAVKLAVNFAIESLDVRGVFVEIAKSNLGSQKIFEACGFQITGVKQDWLWDGDAFQDQLFYQFLVR